MRFNPPPGWLTPGYIGYGQAPVPAGYSQWQRWGPPAPPPSGTSGMAVAGFVLGLLGFVGISAILGVVFGSVALGRIRATGQPGRGLAIAGIVLGSCWLAFWIILIVIGAVVGAHSGTTG